MSELSDKIKARLALCHVCQGKEPDCSYKDLLNHISMITAPLIEAVEALEYYAAMRFNREKMEWMPGNPDKAMNVLSKLREALK